MKASAALSPHMIAGGHALARIDAVRAVILTLLGVSAFITRSPAATIVAAQDQSPGPPVSAPAASGEQPKTRANTPENLELLPANDATAVLGKKVKGPNGEDLGLVTDVLIDPAGAPRAAVIDFGGFLGVGSRKIAIDWKALDFARLGQSGAVGLGLERSQIEAAPEYKPGPPGTVIVSRPPLAPSQPADVHK